MHLFIYRTANCLLSIREGDHCDIVMAATPKGYVKLALPYGSPLYALVDNALQSDKPQENFEAVVIGAIEGSKNKKRLLDV